MKVERIYSLDAAWAKHPASIVLCFVKPAKQTDPKKQRPISLLYIYLHAEREKDNPNPLFAFWKGDPNRGSEEMENKSEIAFFDVETTVPTRPGQGYAILEFGAILVCPQKLEEIRSYSTLVRPSNPELISSLSVRCNGIKPEAVVSAPSFADIADTVYDILHGRIWAGHNIVRFDCVRIREAFAEIGRVAPEPKGTIDSLALLTQKFGRRAGNMKVRLLLSLLLMMFCLFCADFFYD